MSKYAYHPPSRPASADPSVSSRVATLNPISKCLQVALDELRAEDQLDNDGDSIELNGMGNTQCMSSKKRKQSIDVDDIAMKQSSDEHNTHDASEINNNNIIRIDETISKSILDSYSNAVATTKFDDQEKQTFPVSYAPLPHDDTKSTNKTNKSSCHQAPAAILQGEIDHYNRVGSNWRIVIKNATLKSRSVTKVGNGLEGRRYRSRTVLDWDDDDDKVGASGKKKRSVESSDDGDAKRKDDKTIQDDVHRFEGTVQILAYDDKV